MSQMKIRIRTIFVLLLLSGCLFYSCTPGDRFKQHHLKAVGDILNILSSREAKINELFGRITAETGDTENDLHSIAGRWEVIYHYLECLNAEIQAHKVHLYTNDDTANAISTLITSNGDMLSDALANYTEVEMYARMQDRVKLREVLSGIEDNTLLQLHRIQKSIQVYYDLISDKF